MSQRLAFILMLATQALAMRVMTGFLTFPIIVLAVAALGLPGKIMFNLKPQSQWRLAFGLGVAVALGSLTYSNQVFASVSVVLPYKYCYAFAQWCMLFQTAYFFIRPKEGRLPVFLIMPACAAMIFLGTKFGELGERGGYFICAMAFGFALMAFAALATPYKAKNAMSLSYRLMLVGAIVLSLSLGYTVSRLIVTFESQADRFIGSLLFGGRSSSGGFSMNSGLGSIASWKEDNAQEVALRVVAPSAPGYMRGRAFAVYEHKTWRGDPFDKKIGPLAKPPAFAPPKKETENFFPIDSVARASSTSAATAGKAAPDTAVPQAPGQWRTLEVWNDQQARTVVFTLLGSRFLYSGAPLLLEDRHGGIQTGNDVEASLYRLLAQKPEGARGVEAADGAPSSATLKDYLAIPDRLDPQIAPLANEIVAGRKTGMEKITAVEDYFHSQYKYKLGITVPAGMEPINYFLLQRPPAHCEYFASGATVLLRLAGVPCRYVTGFVVTESNPMGGYWIARNRDAHAWVEAYVDGRWVTVEATPASGVPCSDTNSKTGILADFWDSIKFAFKRLKTAIMTGAYQAALQALLALLSACATFAFTTIPGLVALGAILAAGVLWFLRKRRRIARPTPDAAHVALHRVLAKMDRRLARLNLRRAANETINQFAERIARAGVERSDDRNLLARAGEWYLAYAAVRFRGPATSDDIANLKTSVEQVQCK